MDLEPHENGYLAARTHLLKTASAYLQAIGVGHVLVPSGQIYIVPSTASALGVLSLYLLRRTGHFLHLNNENRQGFIDGNFNIPIRDLLGSIKDFDENSLLSALNSKTSSQEQAKVFETSENRRIR